MVEYIVLTDDEITRIKNNEEVIVFMHNQISDRITIISEEKFNSEIFRKDEV